MNKKHAYHLTLNMPWLCTCALLVDITIYANNIVGLQVQVDDRHPAVLSVNIRHNITD